MSNQSQEEVYTGQISYTLFQICGIWKPLKCYSQWKLKFYHFYCIFSVTLFATFTFFCFIDMFHTHEDIESFLQSLFNFFTYFNVFIKLLMVILKRKIFLKSSEMLLSEMCQSGNIHETEILRKSSQIGRANTIYFLIVVHFTAITLIVAPLAAKNERRLPVEYWLPYSLESKTLFALSYLHQTFCIMMTLYISVGMETLALTIMLQICGQLKILMHRLNLLPVLLKSNELKPIGFLEDEKIFKNCIEHHLYVYSIGENVNKQFGIVIFSQFFASMVNLCVIIYSMSRVSLTNSKSWFMMSCIGSYTLQIFIYCYYGDKILEKSLEIGAAIYSLNWNNLTISTKKTLIIIMVRTTRPIKLTASSVIIMSIETFMKIMKSAYSAFNLLKNS